MPSPPDTYEASLKKLAHRLASLRQKAGMSGMALADALSVTQASVSRIETARQRPRSETVMRWAELTNATVDELDEVADLYEALTQEYISFRQEHRRGASEAQTKTLAEETAYAQIRVSQTALVPGLLQTTHYARHIYKLGPRKHTAEQIEKSVGARAERQQQLYDDTRTFDFLIFEQALWATYAPTRVMVGQFEDLARFADFPNVSIAIVPLGTRLPAIPIVSFQMFGDDFVTVETSTGFITIDDPAEVKTYGLLFDEWASIGVQGKKVGPWLTEFIERYTA